MVVPAVRLSMTLRLPRDVAGLHLVRAVTDPVLAGCGVTPACRHDIAVALTEACGNAVVHAESVDEYQMSIKVADGLCVVEVSDAGIGFEWDGRPSRPSLTAVSGRGLYIISQYTDHLHVDTLPGRRTTVRFIKKLEFTANTDSGRPTDRRTPPADTGQPTPGVPQASEMVAPTAGLND